MFQIGTLDCNGLFNKIIGLFNKIINLFNLECLKFSVVLYLLFLESIVGLICIIFFTGSSTACVVVLNRTDQMLYTANIGDSGFLVMRNGQVVHRSEEQTHYFNTPFQLSLAPANISDLVHSDR